MKALTIWQPWASLIIAGAKPYEFRSWSAPRFILGQRIVIHAASRKIDRFEVDDLHQTLIHRDKYPIEAGMTCLKPETAIPILQAALRGELPIAAGVGTAIVGEPRLGTHIAEEFGVPRANDSDRDAHANWGWPMLEIEAWPEPIACKGAQGLWNWPDADSFARLL
ncbi:ASCH domain-containing protein [Sphingobium sp. LSP13-1-1.1]|uniref:ASCH domain-containing protein n=1 Tax=Sphingobium sp. LSP13-1-1.1 TaxID=3135234 RepID=UPI0034391664